MVASLRNLPMRSPHQETTPQHDKRTKKGTQGAGPNPCKRWSQLELVVALLVLSSDVCLQHRASPPAMVKWLPLLPFLLEQKDSRGISRRGGPRTGPQVSARNEHILSGAAAALSQTPHSLL